MNLSIAETPDSRNWSDGECTLKYVIQGTADDAVAMGLLLATAPLQYMGVPREEKPSLAAVDDTIDAVHNRGIWIGTVKYTFVPGQADPPEDNAILIEVDTGGGTQHITQSLFTVSTFSTEGEWDEDTPDFDGAIAVSDDGPVGTDVVVPVFNFVVTKVWPKNNMPSLSDIYALTGRVNANQISFLDTRTGLSITLEAYECLFLGASISAPRDNGSLSIRYSFAASRNAEGLSVGEITGIWKDGWDYLWVLYDEKANNLPRAVYRPTAAYTECVYKDGDMSLLGIST